ncbi:hypothetical protein E2542_SST28387 [Spatholobus suberectus]|nr:hypothetical protein E2542_SST28387 [Spatholobus suberectus]
METPPLNSLDDGHVLPNEHEELQFEPLNATEDGEGEIKERLIRVRDIDTLQIGETIIVPFDGHELSGKDIDGLLGGFLGQLTQNHNNFQISFERWPNVLQSYKDHVFL